MTVRVTSSQFRVDITELALDAGAGDAGPAVDHRARRMTWVTLATINIGLWAAGGWALSLLLR